MNICILGKFFPTQGGMASSVYWQADALSKNDLDVTVISNGILVENEYKIKGPVSIKFPFDVCYIENLKDRYIPNREQDIASLVERFLSLDKKIDIIDAQYLLPFGIVAYFIHLITGVPYIIRHGGSDIDKFLNKGTFSHLFEKVLQNASCVITDDFNVKKLSQKSQYIIPYIPNHEKFKFSPRKKEQDKIDVAYIGKINVLWRYKALDKVLALFGMVKDQVNFTLLGQGRGIDDMKNSNVTDHINITEFISPWEMPAFYSKLDYIVFFCKDNPLPDWPCILLEAISAGVKILTDSPSFFTKFRSLVKNIDAFVIPIEDGITGPVLLDKLKSNKEGVKPVYNLGYDEYINENILLYKSVILTNSHR